MSRRVWVGCAALVSSLLAPRATAQVTEADPVVEEVVVKGPEKTRPETVRAYARVDEGDPLTLEDLARVERRLVATGLFQEVKVGFEPTGPGRVRLVLEVEDKASWVVAPTFVLQSDNVGGGVLYAENNLFGRSKKFATAAQVSTAESGLFAGFLDPNLFGLPQLRFSLEGQLRSDRVDEYQPGSGQRRPEVVRRTRMNSASLAGELGFLLFERVRAAAKYRLMSIDAKSPDAQEEVTTPAFSLGPSQQDASLRLMVGIDTRQNLHAVMEGLNLEASYEVSNPGVGSDFRYERFGLLYRHGLRLVGEHNLVLRGEAVAGVDLPFHQELVMGGNSLRGFVYRQFRGDTRLSFTAEYHFPLFTVSPLSFRGVAFSDTGLMMWRKLPGDRELRNVSGRVVRSYLPDARGGLGNATVAQGVGAGLRLYLRNLVLPLVGVDAAYGVNSGEFRFYLVAGVNPS
ncbi:polymerase [Corallococcus macrosporus DSM 14697]|uniref:Polymerase n=1 Tax=Corallococcus macrosporus DSM 14697 TaxID=1189310 RepID=A0A250JS26_9BACT|nr:polymerase [Corallococcus macrosporus DSM 14697]